MMQIAPARSKCPSWGYVIWVNMHLTWAVDVRGPTDSENAAYTYIDPHLEVVTVVTIGESVRSKKL
jgi:hypothetical protein